MVVQKKFWKMYRQERKEHPTMSKNNVIQIVKDHFAYDKKKVK